MTRKEQSMHAYETGTVAHKVGYMDGCKRYGRRPDWRIAADRKTPTKAECSEYEAGFRSGLASVGG